MDLEKIIAMLKNASDASALVLYAVGIFVVIVLVGGAVIYGIICTRNKKTEMNELIRVGVTLNDWPDNPPANAPSRLEYGSVLVYMHDPASVKNERLDPVLSWLEKASCREYEVKRLLKRYVSALEKSGLQDDAGVALLRNLTEENGCAGLGRISIPNQKKGLVIRDTARKKLDKNNKYRLMVYRDIPDMPAQTFAGGTQCEAKNICITLECISHSAERRGK